MKLDRIMMTCLPHFCRGKVVKGFGRGSKELGIPTANFPDSVVENLPKDLPTGIYYGWAQVDKSEVHKMVMSVGWNPYFHNEKKSMESHIIHQFASDFYGSTLNIVILGYIRGEENFASLDDLIQAINNDISVAKAELDKDVMLRYKNDKFFLDENDNRTNTEKNSNEISSGSNL